MAGGDKPSIPVPQLETTPVQPTSPEKILTLRDEANPPTELAFRNGSIEELHAGKWSPLLDVRVTAASPIARCGGS